VVADEVCQRIERITRTCLECLASDSSGWDTSYREPCDGRLWGHTYPQSERHGGDTPQLKVVSPEAAAKYRVGSA
jgi:hypothetical protein